MVYNPPTVRRLIHSALALVFLTAALAEPVVALQSEHACCWKQAAARAEMASCHGPQGLPATSVSESHSAHPECPSRCCISTARQAARPAPSLRSVAAPHVVASVRAFEFQPLSRAELPAPSGRAPPFRLSC